MTDSQFSSSGSAKYPNPGKREMTHSCYRLSIQQLQLGRLLQRLDAVVGVELAIDFAHLILDRVVAAAQDLRDLRRALSLPELVEDLHLLSRQSHLRRFLMGHHRLCRCLDTLQDQVQVRHEQVQHVCVAITGFLRHRIRYGPRCCLGRPPRIRGWPRDPHRL